MAMVFRSIAVDLCSGPAGRSALGSWRRWRNWNVPPGLVFVAEMSKRCWTASWRKRAAPIRQRLNHAFRILGDKRMAGTGNDNHADAIAEFGFQFIALVRRLERILRRLDFQQGR